MAAFLALAPLILAGAKMAADADKDERNKVLRSKEQRVAPWLTSAPTERFEADPVGTAAQGFAGYVGMDQALENQQMMKDLVKAQRATASLNADVSPYAYKPAGPVRGYEPAYNQGAEWADVMNNPYAMARRGYR